MKNTWLNSNNYNRNMSTHFGNQYTELTDSFTHIGGRYYTTVRDMTFDPWPKSPLVRRVFKFMQPVTVPAGYKVNVSVPPNFEWIVDPHDPEYILAATPHDWVIEKMNMNRILASFYWDHLLKGKKPILLRVALFIALSSWPLVKSALRIVKQ